ncbi:Carbohydrate binding module (family 35) [Flavobacterium aquidurense]|nr:MULTISPECIES: family 43 glycosylhydrolase [Flavobacterium]TDW46635.1 carbohydrate-binding protein with CBM35 doain [Flavobacterium sp. 270]SDZ59023.1 Carbohydrate binding module (family 35) [Flavobacterium aquidurense]
MITKNIKNKVCILGIMVAICFSAKAQNPLFPHIYTADPSVHVWENDPNTLWVYASHDVPGTNHHATMFDYHVFSTTDLKSWTDHGRVLSVDDVSWAISHAWAIDAVLWKGTYYLVYGMKERATGMFRTGLATSQRPEGPFTDIGFIKGVEWGQDPALFVDEDSQAYLFWGSSNSCFAAKLTDDLKAIVPETKIELTSQLTNVFEGPWVHKYQGKYYLSYPGLQNKQWPEIMYYAVADKPLGPYEYKGIYIPQFEKQSGTNHGSIIKYKNNWLAFYHSAWISGVSESRNVMADFLEYDKKGAIKMIHPTKVGLGKSVCTILLEAENGKAAGGKLDGTQTADSQKGFTGRGYVTGFDIDEDYVKVLVQLAKDEKFKLRIRYAAPKDTKINLIVNELMYNGSTSTWKDIVFPKSDNFNYFDVGIVNLRTGDNYIKLTSQNGNINVDNFLLEPISEN